MKYVFFKNFKILVKNFLVVMGRNKEVKGIDIKYKQLFSIYYGNKKGENFIFMGKVIDKIF